MFFSIHANNGVAIYEQIVRRVKFAVAEESLRPGQLLPSVRTLSVQLALNPNKIARAYEVVGKTAYLWTADPAHFHFKQSISPTRPSKADCAESVQDSDDHLAGYVLELK